jgi:hypothetical protein
MKTAGSGNAEGPWLKAVGNVVAPTNSNLYPSGVVDYFAGVITYIAVDGPDHPATQRYVLLHNTDWTFSMSNIVSTAAGRVVFDAAPDYDNGWRQRINVATAPTPATNSTYIRVIREDQEALYNSEKLAGEIEPFNPEFTEYMSPLSCLRFMDWGNTNRNGRSTWASRPSLTQMSWGGEAPTEIMVALCNKTQTNMWYCLPDLYTDAAVTSVVQYIKANLNAPQKLYLEYSNETWNWIFDATQRNFIKGREAPLPADTEAPEKVYAGYRGAQMMAVAIAAWGSERERLVTTLGFQTVMKAYALDRAKHGTTLAGYAMSDVWDAGSVAWYFGAVNGNSEVSRPVILNWAATGETGMVAAFHQNYYGDTPGFTFDDNFASVLGNKEMHDYWGPALAAEGMSMIGYEGGPSLEPYTFPSNDQPAHIELLRRMNADPRMGEQMHTVLNNFRAAGGELAVKYLDFGIENYYPWTTWYNNYTQTTQGDALYAFQNGEGVIVPPSLLGGGYARRLSRLFP